MPGEMNITPVFPISLYSCNITGALSTLWLDKSSVMSEKEILELCKLLWHLRQLFIKYLDVGEKGERWKREMKAQEEPCEMRQGHREHGTGLLLEVRICGCMWSVIILQMHLCGFCWEKRKEKQTNKQKIHHKNSQPNKQTKKQEMLTYKT